MSEELISKLRQSAVVMECLPEYPGYNGSAFVIDDVEAARVAGALNAAVEALSRPAPAVQVPEGWALTVQADGCVIVDKASFGSVLAWGDDDNIARTILHELALDLIAAAPAPAPVAAETCSYPRCTCPFDAPADPGWCAHGLPHDAPAAVATEAVAHRTHVWEKDGDKTRCLTCGLTQNMETAGTKCGVYPLEPVAQGGGVDVEKVMALVGFDRDALEGVAETLETGYEQRIGIGNVTGEGDEFLPSAPASAARIIRALLSASPAGMGGWQPIETAPVGRQMFVAIGVTSGNGFTGGKAYTTDPWCVWQEEVGKFSRWPHNWPPTHWQPLPAAPAIAKQENGHD